MQPDVFLDRDPYGPEGEPLGTRDPMAPSGAAGTGARGVVTLYLSVFVILLAFFIVLYALSQSEPQQVHQVVSSVTETFRDRGQPGQALGMQPPAGAERLVPDGAEGKPFSLFLPGMRATPVPQTRVDPQSPYQRQLADAVVAAIPGARLLMLADDGMEARMRVDALFFAEKAQIRPGREELVDRLVALLANPPPGLAYSMEFRVGTDYDSTKSLLGDMVGVSPAAESADARVAGRARMALALARAGAFARAMVARGAPPQGLAVGVDPGAPDEVRLVFRLRPASAG